MLTLSINDEICHKFDNKDRMCLKGVCSTLKNLINIVHFEPSLHEFVFDTFQKNSLILITIQNDGSLINLTSFPYFFGSSFWDLDVPQQVTT